MLQSLVKDYRQQNHEINSEGLKDSYLLLHQTDNVLWYNEGIVAVSSSIVKVMSRERVIEVDTETKQLLKVNGEEVKGVEHKRVLDLSDEGERWEGDVLNDEPYGWGVLYDSEGEKVYEGFRIKDVNVCYGARYYSDIGMIEYDGEWCEGKRWGRGVQYDRNGNALCDGEWMNNEHTEVEKALVISNKYQSLDSRVETLVVSDGMCNEGTWDILQYLTHLRELAIGDGCFLAMSEVRIIGFRELERLTIGEKSFLQYEYRDGYFNCFFCLKDCRRLKSLAIGCYSFSGFSSCVIEDNPSLEVIRIGEVNRRSSNFFDSSLELRSESHGRRLMNRLTKTELTRMR